MNGKGHRQRVTNKELFDKNYDEIFNVEYDRYAEVKYQGEFSVISREGGVEHVGHGHYEQTGNYVAVTCLFYGEIDENCLPFDGLKIVDKGVLGDKNKYLYEGVIK
ncbi:hypothetical protein KAU11_08240 [Candidatus Babeliales bacterium]|nr:hypothetical protein [Candidatus Babeliales bacterium]